MGECYEQLSLAERCTIAQLREAGQSIRQIAAAVDRPPSTISRELKRNKASKGYRADYAEQQSRARRWTGSKLERDDDLREEVLGRLEAGWSPEQVAGRLTLDHGRRVGDCQDFRVWAGIMGKKETRYVPTQRASDTG